MPSFHDRRPVVLALVILAVFALTAAAAIAHSEAGEMEIISVNQTGPTSVTVEVGIVYADDGHLAEEAEVTATATGPGGPYETTLDLTGGSRYAGAFQVEGPGEYTVVVESTNPDASAEDTFVVEDPADVIDERPASPVEDPPAAVDNPRGGMDPEADSGSGTPWLLLGAGFLVVIGGVIGFWYSRGGRLGG